MGPGALRHIDPWMKNFSLALKSTLLYVWDLNDQKIPSRDRSVLTIWGVSFIGQKYRVKNIGSKTDKSAFLTAIKLRMSWWRIVHLNKVSQITKCRLTTHYYNVDSVRVRYFFRTYVDFWQFPAMAIFLPSSQTSWTSHSANGTGNSKLIWPWTFHTFSECFQIFVFSYFPSKFFFKRMKFSAFSTEMYGMILTWTTMDYPMDLSRSDPLKTKLKTIIFQ